MPSAIGIPQSAFTLVELLVVITIIVVLVALLVPAMEEAVYQAELAVCAGRLDSAAVGLTQYAMESKRSYPDRQGPRDPTLQWNQPLIANRMYDDRPAIFAAVRPAYLLDPLAPQPNIETDVPDNYITCNYDLWFGWNYIPEKQPGMDRIGDRFSFNGRAYNLLISDNDTITGNDLSSPDQRYEGSTHPDRDGVMLKQGPYNDAVNPWPFWNLHGAFATWATWTSQAQGKPRGRLDLNYAFDDTSVQRVVGSERDDPRMDNLPSHNMGRPDSLQGRRLQVPRP